MIQPIRNQVLVRPFPSDEVSAGGIFVPDSARKPSNKVTIVSVGKGSKDRPMKLKPGSTGYRAFELGLSIMIDGQLHYIMDMDAIIAQE